MRHRNADLRQSTYLANVKHLSPSNYVVHTPRKNIVNVPMHCLSRDVIAGSLTSLSVRITCRDTPSTLEIHGLRHGRRHAAHGTVVVIALVIRHVDVLSVVVVHLSGRTAEVSATATRRSPTAGRLHARGRDGRPQTEDVAHGVRRRPAAQSVGRHGQSGLGGQRERLRRQRGRHGGRGWGASGDSHRPRRARVRVEGVVERRPVVGLRTEVVARSAEVLQRADLIAEDATDGTDRRNVELITHAVREQLVADLPREDARVFVLVHLDGFDDLGRRHARLTAADRSWKDGARLVVTGQDLAHAPVRHLVVHIKIRMRHLVVHIKITKITPVGTYQN